MLVPLPLDPFEPVALLAAIDGRKLLAAAAQEVTVRRRDFAAWVQRETVDSEGFDSDTCFDRLVQYLQSHGEPFRVHGPHATFWATAHESGSILLALASDDPARGK